MDATNFHTRGGNKTPTTQSSMQSEDPSPLAGPVSVGFAVGNPAIPDDDDSLADTPPHLKQPLSTFQRYGSEEVTKKKPDRSLQLFQGEPTPDPRLFEADNERGTGSGEVHPDLTAMHEEQARVEPPPEEEPQNAAGDQGASADKKGQLPRNKLTPTQWALVAALLLLAVLIIVIVVVVTGRGSGGGSSNPAALSQNAPKSPPTFTISSSSPSSSPMRPSPEKVSPFPTSQLPTSVSPTAFLRSQTLETITTRGVLRCGVRGGLLGFSTLNGDTYQGFEADLCRAIAAAVLDSAENLEFVEVQDDQEAFGLLQLGSVDILASHIIPTMERDVFESSAQAGFTFSIPYLYDGLSFGGLPPFGECADNLDASGNCSALSICTLDGSSYSSVIPELIPAARLVVLPSLESVYERFVAGSCNAISGATFQVAETAVRNNGYTGNYSVGTNLYSREPLSLVTRDDDPVWSDMVQWILQALLGAEELGVSMNTSTSFALTESFGDSFDSLFRRAVAAVGSYAEVYDRHLRSIVPRREINMINQGNSPLIFSLPFGDLTANGPGPTDGGTLQEIINRGHLRCGTSRAPGFGEFNVNTSEWSGLDVDYCRALSAAIFNGVSNDVDFRNLPSTERFIALANGNVDVLSRVTTWNLERDTMEPTSGVGFSFSQPNFYDGLAVGGQPPFGACADVLDTTSEACQGLKICVEEATTNVNIVRSLFAERYIVPQLTQDEVVAGLSSGACNVIAGGIQVVVESSVRDNGYTGLYETGQNRFSKDPLAMVTRQDDPQFTAFVNWIVTATFYAEEQGITQSTAESMGLVSLFGSLYRRMLIDAIQAVGSYGEIYERNLQDILARGGLNGANTNPFGPQHYPLPGI